MSTNPAFVHFHDVVNLSEVCSLKNHEGPDEGGKLKKKRKNNEYGFVLLQPIALLFSSINPL